MEFLDTEFDIPLSEYAQRVRAEETKRLRILNRALAEELAEAYEIAASDTIPAHLRAAWFLLWRRDWFKAAVVSVVLIGLLVAGGWLTR